MEINQAFGILQNAGGVRAARLITENTKKLSRIKVWRAARDLRRNVPVAKIIGFKWFWGLKFYTNKYTLDPRPDTETLVEAALHDLSGAARILDLGTGTGCIIASIAHTNKKITGVGVDISRGARCVARKNIRTLGLAGRIKIQRGDMMRGDAVREKFDAIVSNPPYIARGDARVDTGAQHDPEIALYADDNGLAVYRAIAKNAKNWIRKHGKLYLEIGDGQAPDVQNIFVKEKWKFERVVQDLAGITRVLIFSA